MAYFNAKELKKIALNALGTNYNLSLKDEIISKAEELIDNRVTEVIKQKSADVTNGISNISNETSDVLPNATPYTNMGSVETLQTNIPTNNVTSQLNSVNLSGGSTQVTNNIPSLPQVPQIPQVPSIGSSIPGGISIDPTEYIPDLGGVPFKAFVKPLLDKALSNIIKKINPTSFIQKAQSSLGTIQQKSISSLKGLESKAQNGLNSAADQASQELQNKVSTSVKELSDVSKAITKEATKAKSKLNTYITVFLQRKFSPNEYQQSILNQNIRTTFQEIDAA